MQRERPALVSVFVFLCTVYIIAVAQQPCSRDLYVRIQKLKQNVSNKPSLNCSLYTPTIHDYEQICPRSTMQCFASEIIVLTEELELKPGGKKLNIMLNKLASRIKETTSECSRCEVMKEENATTFLESLLRTVEKSNSDNC